MNALFLRLSLIGLFLWLAVMTTSHAQTADTSRPAPVGRFPVIRQDLPADTIRPDVVEYDTLSADTPVDTVSLSDSANAKIRKIIPKRAALLSLALPGLGQYYNGQIWKIPLIYAGFTTFGILISKFNGDYVEFLSAYEVAYSKPGTNPVLKKAVVASRNLELDLNQLQRGTEFYRRWRDYNYIFTALFWALNVVDANVTAHLKTFDISDSLTLRYNPVVIPSTVGMVPGISLTLSFRK
ncbi:DUF5683 domain-containing protein [Fibrella aquatilis]|uniref:DUF5683 domain-containing protein n=1 Tax=Fibrella aquatilis TaxID=2817059 RepID=A0A939G5L7_9BACT|nr:DUF5683 domain-containing protein [Fibrella aquatilis]MBO0931633.1 hypothetical protein [Fibrella aquatilis]